MPEPAAPKLVSHTTAGGTNSNGQSEQKNPTFTTSWAINGARKRRRLNYGGSPGCGGFLGDGGSFSDGGSLGSDCESLGNAEPVLHQIGAAEREALEEEPGEQDEENDEDQEQEQEEESGGERENEYLENLIADQILRVQRNQKFQQGA
ncbi:hypothetical protein FN846DRAFT_906106 [Sphaerosporella brunnea]|uniref:Uncharacterized protein n=1 Tax=Sphaerosporella brunnea TaxID=1250544 RepID=A0A5J5F0K0_9PEZI|nr:hypothetical protein FN846DRAFT_906106 [Sphaerosporella brunnea]